ncbi:hypothetical protein [Alysiella crassa]|uniref:Uncharacterized protein n=1 Tax=Alysiella crassa TaxID=153491 RepID=A0A376BV00_9NEIS|nr:hypothetical protein [Alysiella crassa]UOP06188.1 hypothetical protein LVJ80_10180 [Alysiella crassa]SSY80661.1 Uncharacterised protein [Alysiella crassa]
MAENTKRVAHLTMLLDAPTSKYESHSVISPQQWRLIHGITDINHPSHIHKVKQTAYTLLYTAKLESDQTEMAVYIDEENQVWVRPMREFQEKFELREVETLFAPVPSVIDEILSGEVD